MQSARLLLLSTVLLFAPKWVLGHGFMFEPKARNVIQDNGDAGSLSSGGGYEVSGHNTLTWPAGNRDVCGGPVAPTAPVQTYASGSVITISILLTTQHGGRHVFRLCDRTNADEGCLAANVLQRADGQGPYTWTPTEPAKGNSIPASAYSMGSVQASMDVYSGEIYAMQYKLPDGVTCSACTLQWWWTTSNSCSVPGNPFGDGGMGSCTTPQPGPYPEEFMNCADVAITGGAGNPQPTPTVATEPTPVPQPAATTEPTPIPQPTATTEPTPIPQPTATVEPVPVTQPAPLEPAPTAQPTPTVPAVAVPEPTYSRKVAPGGASSCADAACVCQANGDGNWEAPWSSKEFVMCGPSGGTAMPCAEGTLWDQAVVTCNTAAGVNCGSRPF